MESERRVVYTDAAQVRRRQLLQDLERRLDAAIVERKFIPGNDVVEITGSDVEELARSLQIVFRDRYDQRVRTRRVVVNAYLVLGSLTLLYGVFYEKVLALTQQPTRLILIAVGVTMTLAALAMRSYFEGRIRGVERDLEHLRALEERDRRLHETGPEGWRRSAMQGPIVTWKNNDGSEAEAPADATDWIDVVAGAVGRPLLVEFVSNGRGQWWVGKAEQLRVDSGPGPYETAPLDHRQALTRALQVSGKPVVE